MVHSAEIYCNVPLKKTIQGNHDINCGGARVIQTPLKYTVPLYSPSEGNAPRNAEIMGCYFCQCFCLNMYFRVHIEKIDSWSRSIYIIPRERIVGEYRSKLFRKPHFTGSHFQTMDKKPQQMDPINTYTSKYISWDQTHKKILEE